MSSFAALKQQREARRAPRFAPTAPTAAHPSAGSGDICGAEPTVTTTKTTTTAPTLSEPRTSKSEPAPELPDTGAEAGPSAAAAGPSSWRLAENDSLVVRTVEGKGRGVFWQPTSSQPATCRPGDILLRLRPTTSALATDELAKRCSHCHRAAAAAVDPSYPAHAQQASTSSATSLMRCSACKVVKYCNIDCQRGDWQQHREECKALRSYAKLRAEARSARKQQAREARQQRRAKRAATAGGDGDGDDGEDGEDDGEDGEDDDEMAVDSSSDEQPEGGSDTAPGPAIRAMARLAWARKKAGNSTVREQIDRLQSHKAGMDQGKLQDLAAVSVSLAHFLGASQAVSLEELPSKQRQVLQDLGMGSASSLMDAVCKFATNSFALTDSELNSIGVCLDLTAALLNHSCCPNAALVFPSNGATHDGPKGPDANGPMHLVALRDIQPGDEVHISYIDVSDRFVDRQQALQERYLFQCRCPLCRRTLKQQQSLAVGSVGGAGGDGSAVKMSSKWRDPREAVWCPQKCGGWISRPSTDARDASTPLVCNKCRKAARLDPSVLAEEVRQAAEATREARSLLAEGDAAAAWQACSQLLPALVDQYPPSSQPLFDLMRVAQQALIELGSSSLPAAPGDTRPASQGQDRKLAPREGPSIDTDATAYFFEEATRLGMLIAAGCQASTLGSSAEGGPVYVEGHPARAIALATLGKLSLVEIQQQPVAASSAQPSSTSPSAAQRLVSRPSSIPSILRQPPVIPTDARLAFAKQVLVQALRELEIGFGRRNEGGEAGRSVKRTLEELERESAIVTQALREGGQGSIAA
ncbi:uncharacterized protein PFL1_01176 [Pseudozyma flocculosa PF-1]|uniref:SET domain-containing protein n=1 Tax=Pseudozyma flocculosa TaxID=84751 RepID=A0A5C3EVP6_9BASI|nr:uncharacterized protein PFL1_01176 [Pseudozyma flocculosa PF-1]EPQ30987.1 hypothetical protein PFL1_01176 [Pseudozyma flocculosa PF-1]SPO35825.1 uncharacterized protein PSFLO_01296 [Pseudozyma flocculosa]